MKDPDYEINQLLSKIQDLENKNEQMRNKIKNKQKEIKNYVEPKKSKPETKKENQKEKKITIEEDRKAALRFQNEINFLNNNSLQIKDNLVEKIIQFIPQQNYGVMYIMGDFTGWEPEIMQKDKDIFSYTIVLIKGFKYYYSFHSNEQVLIDYDNPYEENPVNLQVQNFIDLYQKEGEKTNFFDYKTDSNILKMAQRNYLLLQINDNIDNTIFLDKFQRHMLALKKESNDCEDDKILESINIYYNNLINKSDIFDKGKLENLLLYLNDRILVQNSPIMEDVEYKYRILSSLIDENKFIAMRLYDHNIIKLNSIYYANIENCWKIPFDDIVLTPINKKDKLYHLLSIKESKKIINDFENDKENIIIAHFNDLDDLNKTSKGGLRGKYGKTNNSLEVLVKPKRIEPDDVELNDYEYYFLNNEIVKIRNKEDNSYIEYEIFEDNKKSKRIKANNKDIKKENGIKDIKEEKNFKEVKEVKDLKGSKYIQYGSKEKKVEEEKEKQIKPVKQVYKKDYNYYKYKKKENLEIKEKIEDKYQKKESIEKEDKYHKKESIENKEKKEIIKKKEKKPLQYLIYYTIYNNRTLILHCHILDKAFKYKKIAIKEIKDNIDPHLLKKDKLYINSNDVLLITNSKGPIKLYYKGKKVQMESKLITQNKLYKIESANAFDSIFHQVVVSVNTIKDSRKLNHDLIELCKENTYKGRDILNGVDVKVEYNNTFDENMMLAVTPCLLRELSPEEENSLKKQQQNPPKKEKKSYELQKFDLIEREMEKYRKYTKDEIKKMTRSQKDNIAITLDDYKSTMDMICNYVQQNELWDMIEQVSSITNEIETLLNLFDQ